MDSAEIIRRAAAFRERLNAARAQIGSSQFPWYLYDSLANIGHVLPLFEQSGVDFAALVQSGRVLDVGCGDGDLAFFFESLGANVTAIDHPRSSHNNLQGLRALHGHLGSGVEIREADLDRDLALGDARFTVAINLGLLYHLRNPLLLLDTLSRHVEWCLLSTRIMRQLPGVPATDVSDQPVAYLVGEDELNADNSNFWIFTQPALFRLFERTNWEVRAHRNIGNVSNSSPIADEADERIFCLLRSRWGQSEGVTYSKGFHAPEDSGWRWTEASFTLGVAAKVRIEMEVFVPPELVPLTLTCKGSGDCWQWVVSESRVIQIYAETNELAFACDRALPASTADNRERAVILGRIRLL